MSIIYLKLKLDYEALIFILVNHHIAGCCSSAVLVVTSTLKTPKKKKKRKKKMTITASNLLQDSFPNQPLLGFSDLQFKKEDPKSVISISVSFWPSFSFILLSLPFEVSRGKICT